MHAVCTLQNMIKSKTMLLLDALNVTSRDGIKLYGPWKVKFLVAYLILPKQGLGCQY